jgi:hypothetical protein
MALIDGSRGLIDFVHQFKPRFKEAALVDHPETFGEPVTAALPESTPPSLSRSSPTPPRLLPPSG